MGISDHEVVLVTWLDITSTAGWEDPDEVEPIEVQTIGWLYSKDDDVVKVGGTLGEDGKPYGITAFPRGCIKKITFLDVRQVSSVDQKATSSILSEPYPKDKTNGHPPAQAYHGGLKPRHR